MDRITLPHIGHPNNKCTANVFDAPEGRPEGDWSAFERQWRVGMVACDRHFLHGQRKVYMTSGH